MLDVGWALRPKRGESVCGDLVQTVSDDQALLVAVIDGLGHGPAAAAAASAAGAFVSQHPTMALSELLQRCSRALVGTRGVAMSVVRVQRADLVLTHVGVGNVELAALSQVPVRPFPRAGVVGAPLPRLVESRHQLHRGDAVVLFSDGVSPHFSLSQVLAERRTAQEHARALLQAQARDNDDASCAVICC